MRYSSAARSCGSFAFFAALCVVCAAGCTPGKEPAEKEEGQKEAPPAAPAATGEGAAAKAAKQSPVKPGAAGEAANAAAAASEALKNLAAVTGAGAKAETVDHRQLKALLPESLKAMKRTNAKSEKTGAAGFSVCFAEAEYEGAADAGGDAKRIQVRITDTSGTGGLAGIAAGWALADIDEESDDGYQKTTAYSGQKAFEKYEKGSKHGEIQVLAGSRFLVEVSGDGVSMDEVKAALGKIDLAKVAALKGAEAPK